MFGFGKKKQTDGGRKEAARATVYCTHDRLERDLFAKKLHNAGIWCETRDAEQARQTASFGSNFIDIQKFAGDKNADTNLYSIDVHTEDADRAKEVCGPRCRVIRTSLI